jgi:hypothetical protein
LKGPSITSGPFGRMRIVTSAMKVLPQVSLLRIENADLRPHTAALLCLIAGRW